MVKSVLILFMFIFLSTSSLAESELDEGDWVGLYLPDYMLDDKEYPDFSWYSRYESYVLIIDYKEKLILKAKVFAGNPKSIKVSEFEGEISNPKLKKQVIHYKDCKLSVEFIREKNIDKLKLKDSGYTECGNVRFDDIYYEYDNPSWKKFENLD